MRAIDLTGQRFGQLVVARRAEKSAGSGQARWECICDCGGTTITHGSNLRRGQTTSCGCAVAEANRKRLRTHGMSKSGGKPGHELYQIWLGIRRRCLARTHPAYPRYGGRGIGIAAVWRDDFERFAKEVGQRPSPEHSLDRIDNDGDYAPGNVRWATPQQQADNRGPVAALRRENAALLAEVRRLRAAEQRIQALVGGNDYLWIETVDEAGFTREQVSDAIAGIKRNWRGDIIEGPTEENQS